MDRAKLLTLLRDVGQSHVAPIFAEEQRGVLREFLLELAWECATRGPLEAQQEVVLAKAKKSIPNSDKRRVQQLIIECWQDLFRTGDLCWGYDIHHSSSPYYHVPNGNGAPVRW